MVTQLHLSIIIAVNAKLLVLDEPTLGLDIIFRKEFYENLLNDYFDDERTILVTTHQVEEIENLLTHVMFINSGRLVLDASMDDLPGKFVELQASGANAEEARRLKPLHERDVFGKKIMTFEGISRDQLKSFGELRTPAIADLFVAKVKGAA
jgi:ABC-2 type transport system ATP-binding protein